MRLGQSYGNERLNAACKRALYLKTLKYRSVEAILKNGLDRKKPEPVQESILPDDHGNVRNAKILTMPRPRPNPPSPLILRLALSA